jgi:hypothetical protein
MDFILLVLWILGEEWVGFWRWMIFGYFLVRYIDDKRYNNTIM